MSRPRVKFAKDQYEVMKKFESIHHPDIWEWIMNKVGRSENLEILDVSEEACVFAISLAEKHTNNKLVIASRGDKPEFDLPPNTTYKQVDFKKNYDDIKDIGSFDLIIVNEVTHEISDLAIFFKNLKLLLKDNAPLVVISRPKNPPLPIPECCLLLWRKLAPTREEIVAAAKADGWLAWPMRDPFPELDYVHLKSIPGNEFHSLQTFFDNEAEMNHTCFSAAVPVSVDRFDWEKILYSGCFPAVKNTVKCTEKEIKDYCNNLSKTLKFEEKMNIFLLRKEDV